MPAQIKSPATSAASPASDVSSSSAKDAIHPHRPPTRPNRSNFDLEPNPFEQSFARPSNDSSVRTHQTSPAAKSDPSPSRPSSADNDRAHTPPDSHKTILPPLAAIASPSDAHYSWAFSSSSFSNSLRSGPLSPAMLTAPQQQSEQPLAAFDPAAFRTGLTPRMGLTPGTGLTPLLGGPVSFPPASPNTAAFLSSVMNNNGTPSLSAVAGTITPNTLSAITGVLSSQQHHPAGPSHVQSPLSMSAVTAAYQARSDAHAATNANAYAASANNAAQTATNGLFLLSQAHQELTKREEEQAAAAAAAQMHAGATHGNAKRGTKRKSYESESPVSASAPVPPAPNLSQKRTRSQTMSSNGRRASTVSLEQNEEEEDDDDDGFMGGASSTSSGGGQSAKKNGAPKKPETEEEKRRNFLERNRQAALKCRQRKKAWLAQLQAKVEFLQNENETLKQALVSSREEIARLSALVGPNGNANNNNNNNGAQANGISPSHNGNSLHHNGHGHHGNGVTVPPMQTGHAHGQNLAAVSLASAAKSVPAMVGGGGRYGY